MVYNICNPEGHTSPPDGIRSTKLQQIQAKGRKRRNISDLTVCGGRGSSPYIRMEHLIGMAVPGFPESGKGVREERTAFLKVLDFFLDGFNMASGSCRRIRVM